MKYSKKEFYDQFIKVAFIVVLDGKIIDIARGEMQFGETPGEYLNFFRSKYGEGVEILDFHAEHNDKPFTEIAVDALAEIDLDK